MGSVVMNIADYPDKKYVSDVLTIPHVNYILVTVLPRTDETGAFCKEYVPMLNGLSEVKPDFLDRLNSRAVNHMAYFQETDTKGTKNSSRRTGRKK